MVSTKEEDDDDEKEEKEPEEELLDPIQDAEKPKERDKPTMTAKGED